MALRQQYVSILATVLGDSGILAATIQFQFLPDCTVLASTSQGYDPGSRSSRYGQGVLHRPNSLLLQKRQERCQVVPTHRPGNQGKNTMLADSDMAR